MIAVSVQAGSDGKCRALALAGGGDKGSYQAAVLKTLIYNLPPIETQYDVVTGVSAGTLNGAAIAAFKPGQEKEYVEFSMNLWKSVKASDIFKYWTGGIATGILGLAPSLLNNDPLRQLLTKVLDGKTVERKFSVGTCDANTAEYVVYTYEPTPTRPADLIETLIASAAIDGVFPPVLRDGRTLVDGGSIWNTNIPSAVNGCRELGYEDKDIIIDYILCAGKEMSERETDDFHAFKHLLNAWEIRSFYGAMGDVERTKPFYPEVNFRYTIAPSAPLDSGFIPLDFSEEHLNHCMAIGEKDALRAIELGEGIYGQILLDYYRQEEEGIDADLSDMLDEALLMKGS